MQPELAWQVAPPEPAQLAGSSIAFAAGPRTDLFVDPGGADAQLGAPLLLGRPRGDFRLSARVSAKLAATFDAAALVVWSSPSSWAKLALEYSPQREPTIVSVVTREISDDANSFALPDAVAWLRISRRRETLAFHASVDGLWWSLVRFFSITGAGEASAGFLVQSPTGDGAQGRFDQIEWAEEPLRELRDGS